MTRRAGPLPIRNRRRDELTPALNGFVDATAALGFARVADFNGEQQAGVAPYPLNVISGRRINTGIAFLGEDVRARRNLTIRGGVEIDRVLFEDGRAVGVVDAEGRSHRAGQVILSAGAFGSPAILLRSGIGPAPHLASLGIPLVAELPVGQGLQEHPFYYNVYALTPDDLRGCATLIMKRGSLTPAWLLKREDDRAQTAQVAIRPRMEGTCMVTLKRAAEARMGVVALPAYICRDELRAGRLRRVLPDWVAADSTISALMPSRRGMSAAARAFIEHLVESFPAAVRLD